MVAARVEAGFDDARIVADLVGRGLTEADARGRVRAARAPSSGASGWGASAGAARRAVLDGLTPAGVLAAPLAVAVLWALGLPAWIALAAGALVGLGLRRTRP